MNRKNKILIKKYWFSLAKSFAISIYIYLLYSFFLQIN